VPEATMKLTDISGATDDLDKLVLENLKEGFPGMAEKYLKEGIPADMESELKGAEKEMVVRGSADLLQQKLRYIGRKTIAKYGCYGWPRNPRFLNRQAIG